MSGRHYPLIDFCVLHFFLFWMNHFLSFPSLFIAFLFVLFVCITIGAFPVDSILVSLVFFFLLVLFSLGIGALYIHPRVPRLVPLLHGGDQEGGRRAGTENVMLIVGLGAAAYFAHLYEWYENTNNDDRPVSLIEPRAFWNKRWFSKKNERWTQVNTCKRIKCDVSRRGL